MNLGRLTVKERRDYLTLVIVYKSLNSLALNYQSDLFTYVSDVHERTTHTRQSQNSDLYEPPILKNHCNIMVLTCGINYLFTFVILITFNLDL